MIDHKKLWEAEAIMTALFLSHHNETLPSCSASVGLTKGNMIILMTRGFAYFDEDEIIAAFDNLKAKGILKVWTINGVDHAKLIQHKYRSIDDKWETQ